MKLDFFDLKFAFMRMPDSLIKVMKEPEWHNKIFVGGGFIRAIVAGETINDVDVFVTSEKDAELLSLKLCKDKSDIYKTDNAYTIKGKLPIQIIHRWTFEKPEDVGNSFDFTICCAVIYFDGSKLESYCDDRFYVDLAAKRIVYRNPVRNEDAGGSMLRVLKYYQKGYRIPLNSLGGVIARLLKGVRFEEFNNFNEERIGQIITGLLREVDPDIDPTHAAHLPSNIEI